MARLVRRGRLAASPRVRATGWMLAVALAAAAAAACGSGDGHGAAASLAMDPPPAAVDDRTPAARTTVSRPRIVALGDSLTFGLGLPAAAAYPSQLQSRLDAAGYRFEVVNAGVSGDTSAGGLRRLAWALDGDVRVLILALGANDGLRGLPVAEMTRNLGEIIRRAKARQIRVLLAGMEAPPNLGSAYTTEFRAAFRGLARDEDIVFLPFLLRGVAGRVDLNQADGMHPNAAGARMIADLVWPALRPMLDADATR